jgi:hypothetical protein
MDTSSQHTLYVSNIDYATNAALPGATPVLYVAGSNSSGGSWRAYSLANPAAPVIAGTAQTTRYMHDSTGLRITDSRTAQCSVGHNPCDVLVDFNVDQVEIWDTTDKLAPVLLGTATNPGNRYIHSGWPNEGGTHVFFHDELEEIQLGLPTRIYTLNLASLRAPTVNVSYTGTTTTTDHNGYTRGNYYYVSHYRRGVVVFDASNPDNLVEVAHFDNYLAPSSNAAGTDGTWGVYPFLPSGNILVSDIENGLFILRDHARTFGQNAGRVGFSTASANHAENVGTINLRVQRVVGNAGAVSVQYATGNATADGSDYTGSNGTLSWAANDMEDKIVAIPVIDDGTIEGAETLTVTLSSPTGGATIDGSSILVITLADNDTAQGGSGGGGGGGGGSTDPALLLLAALTLLAQRRKPPRHE